MPSTTRNQADRSDAPGPSYPRRYWWVVLVIVPMAAALIQYQPWKQTTSQSTAGPGISGNQFLGSAIIGNVSVVVNEAAKVGTTLDPALLESLKGAIEASKSDNHDAAVAKLEAIRAGSSTVGKLPSLLNNLGVEYLSAGRPDQARATFEEVLRKDPTNRTAWAGLGQLPDHLITPVRVANFSSEYGAGGHGYHRAIDIADGDPNTFWLSASDSTLPHSFVVELPVHVSISELSFNNPTRENARWAARDIEVSFSEQSATSGFGNVVKAALTQGDIGQGVSIKPARDGRWIKLRILTNYGDPAFTQLGDITVIGRPDPR